MALRPAGAAAALLLAGLAAPAASERPLPARAAPQLSPLSAIETAPQPRRVRIVAAQVISLRQADSRMQAYLGASFGDAAGGQVVAVQVAEPFVGLTRNASPVIVIDGEPVDSLVSPDARQVYAVLPAGALRQGPRTVQVGWLGDLERTISEPAALGGPR